MGRARPAIPVRSLGTPLLGLFKWCLCFGAWIVLVLLGEFKKLLLLVLIVLLLLGENQRSCVLDP